MHGMAGLFLSRIFMSIILTIIKGKWTVVDFLSPTFLFVNFPSNTIFLVMIKKGKKVSSRADIIMICALLNTLYFLKIIEMTIYRLIIFCYEITLCIKTSFS